MTDLASSGIRGCSDADYLRQRAHPRRGDPLYLICSDLATFIRRWSTEEAIRILDFGADLAPYRQLFPRAQYLLADIAPRPGLDYVIRPDGAIDETDQSFDLIISAQVLEHVRAPIVYLAECFRLVKRGGLVLVTTHGSFEDHGFPEDYQRWTASGLRRDLVSAGFDDISAFKLTVGPRAVAWCVERCLDTTFLSRRSLSGLLHWFGRGAFAPLRPLSHFLVDLAYPNHRVVPDSVPYENFYVGVAAVAKRLT